MCCCFCFAAAFHGAHLWLYVVHAKSLRAAAFAGFAAADRPLVLVIITDVDTEQ